MSDYFKDAAYNLTTRDFVVGMKDGAAVRFVRANPGYRVCYADELPESLFCPLCARCQGHHQQVHCDQPKE